MTSSRQEPRPLAMTNRRLAQDHFGADWEEAGTEMGCSSTTLKNVSSRDPRDADRQDRHRYERGMDGSRNRLAHPCPGSDRLRSRLHAHRRDPPNLRRRTDRTLPGESPLQPSQAHPTESDGTTNRARSIRLPRDVCGFDLTSVSLRRGRVRDAPNDLPATRQSREVRATPVR